MTREEFDAYVAQVERRYRDRPLALKCKVALLLALGYGFFMLWAGPLIALAVVFFATSMQVPLEVGVIMMAIGVVLMLVGAFQFLPIVWTKWEPPVGVVLSRQRCPEFFERLDELRRAARAKHFQRVYLSYEFNACIVTAPRFGIFGWTTTDLVLGLPLLEALSAPEFEAVLMHEFAHYSAKHGRFTAWIYRVRLYWLRVVEKFQNQRDPQRHVGWLLDKWLSWYWQRFHAHAFVLSRGNEYEADREAAAWSGHRVASETLWVVECQALRVGEKFWERVWSQANSSAEPPRGVMRVLHEFLASNPDPEDASRWQREAVLRLTDNANTHPSLKDRVAALGDSVEDIARLGFPRSPAQSAAATWFEDQLAELREEVDAVWIKEVSENWRSRHGRLAAQHRQLEKLDQTPVASRGNLAETLWAKATAQFDTHDDAGAEQTLRQLLAEHPQYWRGNLALGRTLLNRGSDEGVEYLWRILDEEENDLIPDACEALSQFHQGAGRSDLVTEVHRRLSRYQSAVAAANQERMKVLPTDTFLPHDLEPSVLNEVISKLTAISDLDSAYLVRKQLRHFTQQPLFVLCVHVAPGFFGHNASSNAQLAQRVAAQVKLPGRQFVIAPVLGFKPLGKRVMSLPESRIV